MTVSGATVPFAAPYLSRAGIVTAKPVRGGVSQIGGLGLATNHLLGRGNTLIPFALCNSLFTKNGTITLRFKVFPNKACHRRLWYIVYKRALSTAATTVRFTDPSSTTVDHRIPSGAAGDLYGILYTEDVASPAGTETEFAVSFAETTNVSAPYLYGLSCVELPRTDLALDSSDLGTEVSSLSPSSPIYTTTGYGIGNIASKLSTARTVAQRAGFFHFARGSNDYLSTTSGSFAAVFASGAVPVLLGRKLYTADTVTTLAVRARCSSGAGTTGEVRFTMTSGDTLTLSITSAMSSTWLTGDLDVDCEDLSVSDGRRSSRYDKCTIEWQRTGGANSIFLESLSIGNG